MIEPRLLATFGKPFKYQVAAFRLRLADLRATQGWEDLWQAEHDRAFMVAGATKADVLADLGAMVDKAISQGTGLEAFRRDFRKMVAEKGWQISPAGQGTKGGEAWRTRLIYRTNMSTSYAAGRMAQLVAGNYEYWVYRHGASLEPREQHLAWDGLILPPNHPFWATHAPPNGWGCSCYVVGARSMTAAKILGGKPGLKLPDNWKALDPRTGAPIGIDRGWAYAPGASVARTVETLADKLVALPAPLAADLVAGWSDRIFGAWADAFGRFIDTAAADVERGKLIVVGALKPDWIKAARAEGIAPATAEIAVRTRDITHTFRDAKIAQLDRDWYRRLPVHLRKPDAVVLDKSRPGAPALLLVFGKGPGTPKLVLQLNYRLKKIGEMNIVETGKIIDSTGFGLEPGMVLIEGSL